MRGFLEDSVRSYETTTLSLIQTIRDKIQIDEVLKDAFQDADGHNVITDMVDNFMGSWDLALKDSIEKHGGWNTEQVLVDAKNLVLGSSGFGDDVVMPPGGNKAVLYEKGGLGFGALGLNSRDSVVAGTDLWGPVNADLSNITTNAGTPTKTTHNVNMSLNGDLTMNGAELLTPAQKEMVGKIVATKIVEEATDQTAYNGLKPSGDFAGQKS